MSEQKALFAACETDDLDALGRWGNLSEALGWRNRSDENLLMVAARSGSTSIVKFLIPLTDTNLVEATGKHALTLATMHGQFGAVRALLPVSDVGLPDNDGATALYHAVSKSHEVSQIHRKIAQLLMDGRDLHHEDLGQSLALLKAIERGCDDLALHLIPGSDLTVVEEFDKIPALSMAISTMRPLYLIRALTQGSDLEQKDPERGDTALMAAIAQNQPEVVQCLLDAGARIDVANKTLTPLDRARECGNGDVVAMLIAHEKRLLQQVLPSAQPEQAPTSRARL